MDSSYCLLTSLEFLERKGRVEAESRHIYEKDDPQGRAGNIGRYCK